MQSEYLAMFEEHEQNWAWFRSNYRELLKRFDGKYVVSDLWTPAKQRVAKLVKDEKFKEKVLQRFQELEATIIMGNLLSHDNPLAHVVSIEEVKRFCEAVHKLNNVFNLSKLRKFFQILSRREETKMPKSQI